MNNQSPVHALLISLRSNGVKVQITHHRWRQRGIGFELVRVGRPGERGLIACRGGRTVVDLLFPDSKSYTGVADCSVEDVFNRHTGIQVAIQRALTKRKVEQVWDETFESEVTRATD